MDFTKQFKSVVDWNAIAHDGLVLKDSSAVELQWSLVQEEINEVLSAVEHKDFLKEIADLFVVSSYMCYITDASYELIYDTGGQKISAVMARDIVETFSAEEYDNKHQAEIVFAATCDIISMLGTEAKEMLDKVLWSNMTKFPLMSQLIEEDNDPVRLCWDIEEKSLGRYKGVNWRTVNINGEEYVVFKADSGKVVKSCYYQEA